ncbi:putative membrane protein [Enterococcus faecalis D32]|nr:putative membrane protein [Enterococcus faecalis D32]
MFKNKHIQKYLVIVVYLSGVVFLFFMLATVTLLIENSLEVFLKESIVILIGVVIGFLYNLFLVKISYDLSN